MGLTFRSSFVACLVLSGALATAACSKGNKNDSSGSQATTPTGSENAEGEAKGEGDLEAAIADKGPKKVTAIGASGKTAVLDVGEVLAETDTYVVKAVVPEDAAAGGDSAVTINLLPKTGWKINQEFPTKLKVTAPEGVKLAADSQGASDAKSFAEKGAAFEVPFSCESAGDKSFSAKFQFAVCTDATCDPKTAELAWSVKVN